MELSNQTNVAHRVNVNTDDIQKVVLQESGDVADDLQQSQQQSQAKDKVEIRSPIQQIILGKETEAKKDLLKDFIQKVASTGTDILTNPDKGRKDSGLSSELKLLFGSDSFSSSDNVTLSADAKMGQMSQDIGAGKADRAKILDANPKLDDADQAQNERGLEDHLSADHNSIRSQIQRLTQQGDDKLKTDSSADVNDIKDAIGEGNDVEGDGDGDDGATSASSDKDGAKTGLTADQRLLGLSDDGADSDDRSDEKAQDEQSNEDRLDNLRVASKDTKGQTTAATDVTSSEKDDKVDEDKEVDVESKADGDESGDDDVETGQGGRIQLGGSAGDTSDSSGGGDQSHDGEEHVDAAEVRQKVATEQDSKDSAIEKYTQSLRSNLVSSNKDLFAVGKLEEGLLKEHGITSRQLKDMQLAVKRSVKDEIRSNIKDAIINKQLSLLNQYDSAAGDARLNKFTDYFVNNLLLGGQDFGNFDEGFQGLISKAMYYASKDLADFAIDELGEFVMASSLDSGKDKESKIRDFEQKVSDLNKITNNPKITEEWAQTAMEAMMKNLGLAKESVNFDKAQTTGLSVNVSTGEGGFSGQQGKREKHGYEYAENDEKDIFINRLRALYLQRALSPSLRTTLDTEFKIRKLKNGLLKLGVYTEVLNDQVQKEAELVAKDNILDMLREALEERSTLYELKGPAYSLIEHKVKGILKNADKVGIKIDKAEFDKIRDESNYRMFEITRKEVEMIGVRLSEVDLPQLVIKHREMQKLLSRLKEESSIAEDLPSDERLSLMTVVETA